MTVLILVPAGVLFTRVWSDISDRRAGTKLEQKGVEYLAALAPLVSSLAEAQSSALSGVFDPPVSLTTAVNGVAAVDQRLGGDLRTRDRWTGLRQKIELLPKTTGDPLTVLQAHVEVADLTLALYEAVRDNSELARDPDNDLAHLQEAVGVDLPTTVVEVSRMGDYSQLVAKATAAQLAQLSPQFGAAVLAVNTYVNSLTDNLQAAVDNTTSGTLSGSLVSGLDSFRRGVESLTRGANPGGLPNSATMATAQSQLQVSLSNLSNITVREMAALLQNRLDRLAYRQAEALAAGVLIALLIIGAVLLPLTGRRRRARPVHSEAARDVTVGPGDADTTRREHAGALR